MNMTPKTCRDPATGFGNLLALCALLFVGPIACAQSRADSLLQIIQETPATGTFADTALSRMYIRLAAIQARDGEYDSSFVRTERAIELLTELEKLPHAPVGVGQQLIMAYKQQGRLHLFESRYDQSLKCMQQAHKLAEELKDTLEIGATLLQMAHAFREMNDTAQALGYNRKAISLLSLIPLNKELALGLMSMGGTYTNVDIYDSAAYYLRRALAVYVRLDIPSQIAAAHLNLAQLHNRTGNYDSSDAYLKAATPFADAMGPSGRLRYHGMLARSMITRKQFKTALDELDISADLAQDNPADMAEIEQQRALAFTGLGQMDEAMAALQRGNNAMVADLDLAKVQEVTESRMKYEHEVEVVLAQQKIEDQRRQKLFAFVTIGLVVLLGAILFVSYRSVRKNALALRTKNDELTRMQDQLVTSEKKRAAEVVRTRIARDIHDEIGGELTKIKLLGDEVRRNLTDQPKAAMVNLASIETAAQQANAALHDIVWATDPGSDTVRSLVDHARSLAMRMLEGSEMGTMEFMHQGPDRPIAPEWRRDMLRFMKEAMNNALKYAGPTRIDVSLSTTGSDFDLRIRDHGSGFDPTTAIAGNGLRNLRSRAASMGAAVEIDTTPDHGCSVHMHGPLSTWV